MVIDLLNKLRLSGDLNKLIDYGLLKDGVKRKMNVYLFFNKELLINKDKGTAIVYTCDTLKISESYVYKSISLMERSNFNPDDYDLDD